MAHGYPKYPSTVVLCGECLSAHGGQAHEGGSCPYCGGTLVAYERKGEHPNQQTPAVESYQGP